MPARRGRRSGASGGSGSGAGVEGGAPQCSEQWRPTEAREAECAVCGGLLVEPARLPCGHRFCLECVRSAVLGGAGAGCCPLCRKRCAGWLRRATLQQRLVDEPLWLHIQATFPRHLAARLVDSHPHPHPNADSNADSSQPLEVVHRKLSAPGEIRSEYEAELQRIRIEQHLIEQKHSIENEKIIRELQEQERLELLTHATKLEHDEKFARELSVTLNSPAAASQSSSVKDTPNKTVPTKEFYNHLGKTINGCKSKTLDSYILRSKEKVVNRNSSPPMTATSPELVSTAGRCGRFLKNFLNKKLWGFGVDATDSSHIGSSSKIEPKVWEPERICQNSDHELSVNAGIVIHRNTSLPKGVPIKKIISKDVVQHKLDSDIDSEDSISQELRYFKPIQPNPISRFNGRLVKCLAVKKYINNNVSVLDNTVLDKLLSTSALEKLRGAKISNLGFQSAFVCLLTVPKSHIKTYEVKSVQPTPSKTPEKKCKLNVSTNIKYLHLSNNNKNGDYSKNDSSYSKTCSKSNTNGKKNGLKCNNSTPKKTSPMRTRSKQVSQSCVKEDKSVNLRCRVSTRLKRSVSFGDVALGTGETTPPNNHRVLRSNGHSAEKCNGSDKIRTNGLNGSKVNGKVCNGDDVNFRIDDPSLVEEQRRIEELLAQEKRDLALAKKLQRQLGRQVINTGYTLRTAAKRQATLTELLPPAKNMRI
ncbi:uncharacterized protein LOC143916555 [Arctopsyche grandis]|uniref:uncharacterized protein LOC143916555 n=1 Tax=Arctopsyche grandis TaxID=121162 RepID=UPI00406DA188